MKFVLVNGRTSCPQSYCALCCEPIGLTAHYQDGRFGPPREDRHND
jgi:hypothetical protein